MSDVLFGCIEESIVKISSRVENLYENNFMEYEKIEYDPRNSLDDSQCYILNQFSSRGYGNGSMKDMLAYLLKNKSIDSSSYSLMDFAKINQLQYLIYHSEIGLLFESVTPSKIIKKKWLSISGEMEVISIRKEPILVFKEFADAMYNPLEDTLYFTKLDTIKKIFTGIEELYRKATDKELNKFMACRHFDFQDFTIRNIKIQNRKRIALIYDKWKAMNSTKMTKYQQYADKYGISISNNKFVIKNNANLKDVLFIIDERYHETEIEKEKRIAIAIQSL